MEEVIQYFCVCWDIYLHFFRGKKVNRQYKSFQFKCSYLNKSPPENAHTSTTCTPRRLTPWMLTSYRWGGEDNWLNLSSRNGDLLEIDMRACVRRIVATSGLCVWYIYLIYTYMSCDFIHMHIYMYIPYFKQKYDWIILNIIVLKISYFI